MNLKWTSARLDKLKQLYSSGLSMLECGKELDTSIWAVNNAMRRNKMSRRTPSETNKINFLRSPLSYKEKTKLTRHDESLKLAGLMLYWAEGSKKSRCTVDLANSDEKMIMLFLKFLRIIYGVKETKLRVYTYCYSDQNPNKLVSHWSKMTNIPTSQFSKPYVKTAPNSHVHGKMKYGLVHIRYADTRLLAKIKQEIGQLTDILISRGGRVIKYTSL